MMKTAAIGKMLAGIWIVTLTIAPCASADDWMITSSSFESKTVSLGSIDEKTLAGKNADQSEYSLPLEQFIEASRQIRIEQPKGLALLTANGDRLLGKPLKIDGSNLVWSTNGLGDISIPLEQALGIARGTADRTSFDLSHTEDEIHLTNGDLVKGIVTSIGESSISITPTGAQAVEVPMDSVKELFFTTPPQGRSSQNSCAFVLHLASGAIVSCKSISIANPSVEITLASGAKATIDQQSVAMIEHLGSSLNWLASRKPEKVEYTPYFSGNFPPTIDKTVTGEPIKLGDTTWHRGIGMHSRTRMTWAIQPADKTFRARYFIDPDLGYADVDVRVFVDDKKVHEQLGVKAGNISQVVSAELSGAKTLTLEVDYGKGYDVQDRVNWVEAAILK